MQVGDSTTWDRDPSFPTLPTGARSRAGSGRPGLRRARLSKERFDEAIVLYEGALSVLPNAPQLHFNLGVAREDVGAPQSALAEYERCIELAPDDADAHYCSAFASGTGPLPEGAAILQRIPEARPSVKPSRGIIRRPTNLMCRPKRAA
nr:tetratricopeptide repeat protein [Cupriavidus lacunae]